MSFPVVDDVQKAVDASKDLLFMAEPPIACNSITKDNNYYKPPSSLATPSKTSTIAPLTIDEDSESTPNDLVCTQNCKFKVCDQLSRCFFACGLQIVPCREMIHARSSERTIWA